MKGILFTEPMFRAVIAGQKTQTRRIGTLHYINYQADVSFIGWETDPIVVPAYDESKTINWKGIFPRFKTPYGHFDECYQRPRYQPGEIVYLKEPYLINNSQEVCHKYIDFKFSGSDNWKWQNKLFMPAKYARYFIRIKDVRVERIFEISNEDAIDEGFSGILDFMAAFKKINKLSVDAYPWVFAYTFELISKPETSNQ